MGNARDRLITAALKVAAAERGGLDQQDAPDELGRAIQMFDQAVVGYYHAELEEQDAPDEEEG